MAPRAFLASLVALSTTSSSPTARCVGDSGMAGFVGSPFDLSETSFPNVSVLSKRWDGSPAMGRELTTAKGKACTLWPMMHLDDAKAGQMFTPPRVSAHSDYLQLDGMSLQCSLDIS